MLIKLWAVFQVVWGLRAHTLTDSKIVSIPDMLIKPLKHLFVTNCPGDLPSALYDGHVGVWAWRGSRRQRTLPLYFHKRQNKLFIFKQIAAIMSSSSSLFPLRSR